MANSSSSSSGAAKKRSTAASKKPAAGAQVSGNPQRRAQQSGGGPDYDRIAELEEQLARARAAEDAEFEERFDAEVSGVDDEPEAPQRSARRGRGDQDKPKLIHVKGETYKLPASVDDMSIETLNAFEEGRATSAVKGAVGDVAWKRMNASGVKVRDLEDVMSQIAKAYGFDSVGESDGS